MPDFQILRGDVRARLREVPDGVVRCCVTSPPYWGLRDYGVDGQIGLEDTPEEFARTLVEVFREVRRALADDGTLWLNLGDCYSGVGKSGGGPQGSRWDRAGADHEGPKGGKWRAPPPGYKTKDLVGLPWLVAFALRADGWYLRSEVIWHKPNPVPESVVDRPTKAHETLFLLSKSRRYHYDADAIAEPRVDLRDRAGTSAMRGQAELNPRGRTPRSSSETRNRRTVWTIATSKFSGAHFATFPPDLVEPCILASSEPGDVVLDPFTGAGTTGLVALRHGRDFLGVELNPAYADLAEARIAADVGARELEARAA